MIAGRDCIAPEVNRIRSIGAPSSDADAAAFQKYLQNMTWQTDMVRRMQHLMFCVGCASLLSVRSAIGDH